MLVSVHVRPGARVPRVGGSFNESLVVHVKERAIRGGATRAVEKAVAIAMGVHPRSVRCIRGATSRDKVLEIDGDDDSLRRQFDLLRHEVAHPECR
jgi:uncharacterized protein YggU (UPF0235/DUF167 family)